jgi:hypothetical protein
MGGTGLEPVTRSLSIPFRMFAICLGHRHQSASQAARATRLESARKPAGSGPGIEPLRLASVVLGTSSPVRRRGANRLVMPKSPYAQGILRSTY